MKVAELDGVELDRWVARALDIEALVPIGNGWSPSTSWGDGGPIIGRERIAIIPSYDGKEWEALYKPNWGYDGPESDITTYGKTALSAAMRCFVAAKYGNEVEERQV